jgi:hypothetical protein
MYFDPQHLTISPFCQRSTVQWAFGAVGVTGAPILLSERKV